jgi:hypothetical protein
MAQPNDPLARTVPSNGTTQAYGTAPDEKTDESSTPLVGSAAARPGQQLGATARDSRGGRRPAARGGSGGGGGGNARVYASGAAGLVRNRGDSSSMESAAAHDAPSLTLNDICPNVCLSSFADPDELEGAEAQQRRLFLLTAAACCVTNSHIVVATSEDDDMLGGLYMRRMSMSPPPTAAAEAGPTPKNSSARRGGHQRTHSYSVSHLSASNVGFAERTATDVAAAVDSIVQLLAPSLPPNHKHVILRCTEDTTREDISTALDRGQSYCPSAALMALCAQRGPVHRRTRSATRVPAGGGGMTAININNVGQQQGKNLPPRGHGRTLSLQSNDSNMGTPEPSVVDAPDSEPLPQSDELVVMQASPAIMPRAPVPRRTSSGSGGEPTVGLVIGAGPPSRMQSRRQSMADHGTLVGPAAIAAADGSNPKVNTTVLGTILIAIGIHRLAPSVADAFATFLRTGTMPTSHDSAAIIAGGAAPPTHPALTVLALTSDPLVPGLHPQLREGFLFSTKLSIVKLQVRVGSLGRSQQHQQQQQQFGGSARPSASVSRGVSGTSTPVQSPATAPGGWAAAGVMSAVERNLHRLLNHDLFVVMCAAKVTARPTEQVRFGVPMRRAFNPGESGGVVTSGPSALLGARMASPGVSVLRTQGRVYCHTSVERYMRQQVALLRTTLVPLTLVAEGAPQLHPAALDATLAAAVLLSRLSLRSADDVDGLHGTPSCTAGSSVEAAFELVLRAAPPPQVFPNPRHVDPRYLSMARDVGAVGRRVERALVTGDDVLCLLPHLTAHHVAVPGTLLDACLGSSFTGRIGNSTAPGAMRHVTSGGSGTPGFTSPMTNVPPAAAAFANAIAHAQGGPSIASASIPSLGGFGSQPIQSPYEWESSFVESSVRVVRQALQMPRGPALASPVLTLHPPENAILVSPPPPMPPPAVGAFPAGMPGLGLSTHLTMSAQLHTQDSAEFSALARKRSFNTSATFNESNIELLAALVATSRAAQPFTAAAGDGTGRSGGAGGTMGGHLRTNSQFSATSFSVDEEDSSHRHDDSPTHRQQQRPREHQQIPWASQLETEKFAPYSRCWDAVAARLLDNQSVIRPPA